MCNSHALTNSTHICQMIAALLLAQEREMLSFLGAASMAGAALCQSSGQHNGTLTCNWRLRIIASGALAAALRCGPQAQSVSISLRPRLPA